MVTTDYEIFGCCLRSEVPFPDLRAIRSRSPRWKLAVSRERPPLADSELLGAEDIGNGTDVRLYASALGYRLEYDDRTGSFDVSANGRDITWYPGPNLDEEMVRLHVIGRVLATALHAAGMYCLHGSGVALGGEAIGFVAPRFWGKSTLAFALARSGARLLSDDTLAMDPDDASARCWPGVHSVRLWGDSAEKVAGDDPAGGAPPFAVKRTFNRFPEQRLARRPVRLSALYFLAPYQENGHGPVVRRARVSPVPAALALVGNAKIGALLGKSEAPQLFDRAVRVASRVRAYRLDFPRDLGRIDAVVAQIRDWHRAGRAAAVVRP
jgi:hypothetical protein